MSKDLVELDDLKRMIFPKESARFQQNVTAPYSNPKVRLGYWYEYAFNHPLVQGIMPMMSTYQDSYKVQDLRPERKRLELWNQEPHELYNFSRASYHNNMEREGVAIKSCMKQGEENEFDNNFATMYSLFYKNAKTKEILELLIEPTTDKLNNFGKTADFGLKEYMEGKWEDQNMREALYPPTISEAIDSYQQPRNAEYLPRKATPKELSSSFFRAYIDNLTFETRGVSVNMLPDHPDHLKGFDPNRKALNIFPFC